MVNGNNTYGRCDGDTIHTTFLYTGKNNPQRAVIPPAGMELSYILNDISQTDPGKND